MNDSTIVIDESLTDAVLQFRIKYVKGFSNSSIFLYMVAKEVSGDKSSLFTPDRETESVIVHGMNKRIDGLDGLEMRGFYRCEAKRYAIPAFEEYRALSVKSFPLRIAPNYVNDTVPYIILPFTKE